MKIAIIGAGLTGCTLAHQLGKDHDVQIFEKAAFLGGLCRTGVKEGLTYSLYGAHIFHTFNKKVWRFINSFLRFSGYQHRVGIVKGSDEKTILDWPPTHKTIKKLQEFEQIMDEVKHLPGSVCGSNFEEAAISVVGPTLYKLFIGNYTKKQWGLDPRKISPEWVGKRISLRMDNYDKLFRDPYQGTPLGGYNEYFEKTTSKSRVWLKANYRLIRQRLDLFDIIVSTIPIDEMFDNKFGLLKYRGMTFRFLSKKSPAWPDRTKGVINYPDPAFKFIRRVNMQIHYNEDFRGGYIEGREFPGGREKMYPVHTDENNKLFEKYLRYAVRQDKIIMMGRLGLFNYMNMDRAIEHSLDATDFILHYPRMTPAKRFKGYQKLLGKGK